MTIANGLDYAWMKICFLRERLEARRENVSPITRELSAMVHSNLLKFLEIESSSTSKSHKFVESNFPEFSGRRKEEINVKTNKTQIDCY